VQLRRFPAVLLARELAREAQRKVAKGGDPVVEKCTAREAMTFGEFAEYFGVWLAHVLVSSAPPESPYECPASGRLDDVQRGQAFVV
jgi:hypothetical protein